MRQWWEGNFKNLYIVWSEVGLSVHLELNGVLQVSINYELLK